MHADRMQEEKTPASAQSAAKKSQKNHFKLKPTEAIGIRGDNIIEQCRRHSLKFILNLLRVTVSIIQAESRLFARKAGVQSM